ncbi:hypothetical protein BP5796_01800 [Coleophoma crateriformis]|uniref:Uncharacterized protein n=1 Tax=Coleophoma crateriformis TaxID=565419 RepID=A0A3D8T1H5_9HELO|nr:hypothetical protein BP5796_01800 [Coleophoma crateriformis]
MALRELHVHHSLRLTSMDLKHEQLGALEVGRLERALGLYDLRTKICTMYNTPAISHSDAVPRNKSYYFIKTSGFSMATNRSNMCEAIHYYCNYIGKVSSPHFSASWIVARVYVKFVTDELLTRV